MSRKEDIHDLFMKRILAQIPPFPMAKTPTGIYFRYYALS
jgi:hypothetical protein